MTSVLLECKRKAVELTKSDNPPLQDNGRKNGFMCLMTCGRSEDMKNLD